MHYERQSSFQFYEERNHLSRHHSEHSQHGRPYVKIGINNPYLTWEWSTKRPPLARDRCSTERTSCHPHMQHSKIVRRPPRAYEAR